MANPVEDGLRLMAIEFRKNADDASKPNARREAFGGRALLCTCAANEIETLCRRVRELENLIERGAHF